MLPFYRGWYGLFFLEFFGIFILYFMGLSFFYDVVDLDEARW